MLLPPPKASERVTLGGSSPAAPVSGAAVRPMLPLQLKSNGLYWLAKKLGRWRADQIFAAAAVALRSIMASYVFASWLWS